MHNLSPADVMRGLELPETVVEAVTVLSTLRGQLGSLPHPDDSGYNIVDMAGDYIIPWNECPFYDAVMSECHHLLGEQIYYLGMLLNDETN